MTDDVIRSTLHTFAGIGLAAASWCPRQVVVELLASLAVEAHRVVRTLTFAIYLQHKI